jgi:TolB-like protein/Flp pilus assembly protein TadD
MSRLKRLTDELKRRRVFRVAVVYAVVAFVIWQAAEIAVPGLNLPGWVLTLVILLTVLGFPIALVLAWALELTPEGIRVTPPAEPPQADAGEQAPTGAPVTEPCGPAPARAPTDDRPCVVVLPFANLSGDPENEFFSDGVTEDIMARLAGIRGLRVISRTTAMTYKGSQRNLPQIAEELGVQAVVEGTVRRSGDRVRVTAQLIAADRDENLWAETYDRVLKDVFAVQSDVAENIAQALDAKLTPGERERLLRRPTENLEAYDLCLKGMRVGESLDPEALRQAERYFREAIALDPGYARAHAGLAWTLGLHGFLGNVDPAELFPQVKAAAQEAIRLDPNLGEAHAALAGLAFWHEWDWAKAERELETALELNPDDSYALGFRGWVFQTMERFTEAEPLLSEAVRLDPLSPLKRTWLAQLQAFGGRPEEGVASLDRLLRHDPHILVARDWRGICHLYSGNLPAAAADLDKAIATFGRVIVPLGLRGVVHALAGETEQARQILDELRSRATEEYVDPYWPFSLCSLIDGFDAAVPYLEQMIETRSVRVVPRYTEYRSDPRFMAALRTIWPDDF